MSASWQADFVSAERSPVECISAVTLLTRDMGSAVGFYTSLGFEMLYGGETAGFSSFRAGPGYLNLQLIDPGPTATPGLVWGRIVFWVEDVDAMYDRVVRTGTDPEMPPSDAPWGERFFHVRDPDGHELSFARPVARAAGTGS